MHTPRLPLLAALAGALLAVGCEDDLDVSDIISTPEEVILDDQPGLYPEGIDYSSERDAFVVTSLTTGRIGLVDDDGVYSVLVDNDTIISAIGVLVDEERDRVLVAMSDPGASPNSTPATANKTAQLGSFSLDDGSVNWVADLAALNAPGDSAAFANDIAVDDDGTAYVTNSFSPYLYEVSVGGAPSVLLYDSAFALSEPGTFGFNGIVHTDDDQLLVAYSATNSLYRLDLAADTASLVEIAADIDIPASPDGLELTEGDELAVICNADGVVLRLETEDGWATVTEEERYSATLGDFPTTGVERGGELFVLYAYLDQLFAGDASRARYPIERLDF